MKKIAKYILNQVAANQISSEEAKIMLLELEPPGIGQTMTSTGSNGLGKLTRKKAAGINSQTEISPNQLNFFYELQDFQQPFEINQEETRALRIQPHTEIVAYLCHGFFLNVILNDPKLLPWFYEHYVDLFVVSDTQGFIKLDFLEYRSAYKEVLNEVNLGYDLLPDAPEIIDFIREKIDLGFYVLIHMDEYYLPVKKLYQKEHFTHNSMIFGYDDRVQKFRAMGFNASELFGEIVFDYEDVAQAFEEGKKYYRQSAPWAEYHAVELLKLKQFKYEYPFDMRRFLGKLDGYLSATGDSSIIFSFNWELSRVAYGLDVHRVIIGCLEGLLEGRFTIDYRAIHLLYEHKKGLYKRLQYALEKLRIQAALEDKLQEYLAIIDQVGAIRRKFLELNFAGDVGETALVGIIREAMGMIQSIKETEQKVLQAIRDRIRDEIGY